MRYLCAFVIVGSLFSQSREQASDHFQRQRERWFYTQRKFPLAAIPAGARVRGIESLHLREQARRAQASLSNPTWTLIGPRPTDDGTTYSTAGRVNAIAIDPRSANVVYIGTAEGGVWKTVDGGLNWTPLTDNQASLANGAIALDPTNPDIVYVGTGEENFAVDSYYGAGFLKSQDGGQSWTNIIGPFLRDKISAVAVQPSNGQVLLASSSAGVWRSADAAQTWTRVIASTKGGPVPATSVLFDPGNNNTAYAAVGSIFGNTSNGVYKSTDSGVTWTRLTGSGAAALPTRSVGRIELAIAPSSTNILFASIHNTSDDSLLGIWKTVDGGQTWNQLPIGPALTAAWGAQLWYDNTIRVSPKDPNIVWAGALGLYRSLDGGATFKALSFVGQDGVEIHVDQHQIAFTPDGTKLYIANDGGIYSTTGIGAALPVWTTLNRTLAITQFYPGLSADPANPALLFGGTQDNGTQRYTGSANWQGVTCGDGGYTALYTAFAGTAFAACQNIEILRTDDGGSHWVEATYGIDQGDNSAFIAPMVSDPSNGQLVYFGTYRVWQSRDGSGKYVPISPDLGANSGVLSTLAVAPSDSNTIYAGTDTGLAWVTRNAGASWQKIVSGLPVAALTHITVDPLDPTTAFAAFSGFNLRHLWKTSNAGGSWTDISGNLPDLPVNDLVIDPDVPGSLYVATDAGVMASADGGGTWNTLGAGLPRVVVLSLSLQRKARLLRAATHGRSVWEISVLLNGASAQPQISSLSPAQGTVAAPAFSLKITGVNFGPGMTVRWNGQDRATTYLDNTHLSAQIPATDLASVGLASVLVFSANAGGGNSNSTPFPIGPAPASSSAAFVSAANPAGGAALAPLSLASVYGTNLASGVSGADAAPPLPFFLGGASVTIAGTPAALLYVSPGQINLQIPSINISRLTIVPMVIKQGQFTSSIDVKLQPFAPAIFTINSQGSGQAAALINGTAALAAPMGTVPGAQPASIGQTIALFCTGLGPVRFFVGDGNPAPLTTPDATTTTPTLTVGGVLITPLFSGLAPGFVGLYQVNFAVPAGAPTGDAVPLVLTIGGVISNTATIAIH